MKKEFIPYNLALLMKELGYAEPSAFYWADEIITIGFPISNYLGSRWVAALLYQQCFRWFREKHKLYSPITDNGLGQYDFRVKHEWCGRVYDTYEEAEQACLEKLIEIVKNKNGEKS